jgi:hypothetical protein
MNINISKNQKMIIGAILVVVAIGGIGYYFFFAEEQVTTGGSSVNNALLTADIRSFLSVKEKIDFKDMSFTKKEVYANNELVDYSEVIPFKVPEGRPNPFVPYVAP